MPRNLKFVLLKSWKSHGNYFFKFCRNPAEYEFLIPAIHGLLFPVLATQDPITSCSHICKFGLLQFVNRNTKRLLHSTSVTINKPRHTTRLIYKIIFMISYASGPRIYTNIYHIPKHVKDNAHSSCFCIFVFVRNLFHPYSGFYPDVSSANELTLNTMGKSIKWI